MRTRRRACSPACAIWLALLLAACSRAPAPPPAAAPAPAATPASGAPSAPATATTPPAAPAAVTGDADAADPWLLPGSLHPLTTQAELEARFGKANLREETRPGPEGEGEYPVLVVFPEDPARRLELVLDARDRDAPLRGLRVSDAGSRWHDASGLRPGMPLAQLVQANGAPISFYGLDWDYGGGVQDWHGGRLANGVDAVPFRAVTLAARAGLAAGTRLPQGDRVYRSDDPAWPGIGENLVVGTLALDWPDPGP